MAYPQQHAKCHSICTVLHICTHLDYISRLIAFSFFSFFKEWINHEDTDWLANCTACPHSSAIMSAHIHMLYIINWTACYPLSIDKKKVGRVGGWGGDGRKKTEGKKTMQWVRNITTTNYVFREQIRKLLFKWHVHMVRVVRVSEWWKFREVWAVYIGHVQMAKLQTSRDIRASSQGF